VHVGTSGWGYPSWQPGFYPAGLDRSGFLSFYAARLDAVELNATKYRLPSEEQFRSWAAQVPVGFRFAVKAPDGVERRLATFEERVRALGDRLGCVRVVVERPRDDGLLELLLGSADPRIRYAFDLRDPTWDGVEERLAEVGAVRVGDTAGHAGWAYLRFRELHNDGVELARIAAELDAMARVGIETYAFFRHGDAPDAPLAALRITAPETSLAGARPRRAGEADDGGAVVDR
jgi:uncharacterized protein YecE (DUF72 family)